MRTACIIGSNSGKAVVVYRGPMLCNKLYTKMIMHHLEEVLSLVVASLLNC